jgi:hypothetical protein
MRPKTVFRVKVTGQNPGRNACTVAMDLNGRAMAVVSESDSRTAPQAELDGVVKALRALPFSCDVEVRTCSTCLVSRINGRIDSGIALACMDGGHSVRAVWVPKGASCNAPATEAVHA